MLVTKTGFRRHGSERHNYKNLVWLGRPANVASKLTDIANKPAEGLQCDIVCVGYESEFSSQWNWVDVWPSQFAMDVSHTALGGILHSNPNYRSHYMKKKYFETRPATDPILMTEPVHRQLRIASPSVDYVKEEWFKNVLVEVPGYRGDVFGGDVIFKIFSER